MDELKNNPDIQKILIQTAIAESLCIGGGIAFWLYTDRAFWILAAIVLAVGAFTIPAIIKIHRISKNK